MPLKPSKKSSKLPRKEIEFNGDDLVRRVRRFADHVEGKEKLTLRIKTLTLPQPVKSIKPEEIKAIRNNLHVSQPVFASMLNVAISTAISWEKGRRKPTGAALRLLEIVRCTPDVIAVQT